MSAGLPLGRPREHNKGHYGDANEGKRKFHVGFLHQAGVQNTAWIELGAQGFC